MRRISWILVIGIALGIVSPVYSAGIETEPGMLEWEGMRRDEFRQDIRITNRTTQAYRVWPTVADRDVVTGAVSIPDGPGAGHHRMSTWAEIPRSDIYLRPGETEVIPVKFRINVHAADGEYHGAVLFTLGESMEAAYRSAGSAPYVPVSIRVRSDVRERLNLLRFLPTSRVFVFSAPMLNLILENGGNVATEVSGNIRVVDRKGREVGEVAVRSSEGPVAAGARFETSVALDFPRTLGRHKAFLEVPYGKGAVVTGAVPYWVVPVWFIAGLMFVAVFGAVAATRILHRNRHE